MKTGSFTPKPGELFQWHYDIDDSICQPDDKLWAKSPYRWIPCVDNSNLLIALTDTDIWWVNSQKIFRTNTHDMRAAPVVGGELRLIHARVDDIRNGTNEPWGPRSLHAHIMK